MIEQFIHDWGYVAVGLGALAEGETVLLAAGYAAHQGLLNFGSVLIVAIAAATAGDQLFYWLGRRWGVRLLARLPRLAAQFPRMSVLLRRYPHWAIVGVRFLYGLRIAGPIIIGAAGVTPKRFALFNLIGASLWAPIIAGLGWAFGEALSRLSLELQHIEGGLLLLIGLIALMWVIVRRRAGRNALRRSRPDKSP